MAVFVPTRRDVFYCRMTVPLRLRAILGRNEVWRSLRTADKELAQVRAGRWKASGRQLFLTLKRYGDLMTRADMEHLVQRWLDTALDDAEHERLVNGPVSDRWLVDRGETLSVHHDSLFESLLSHRFERMASEADELLQAAGLPLLDHGSVEFKQLCRRLIEAHLEYTNIQQDRLSGCYATFRGGSHGIPTSTPSELSLRTAATTTVPTPTTKLFSEVAALYYRENPARSKRSGDQVQAELRRFIETIGGDRQIGMITKDLCRAYRDELRNTRKLALVTVSKWVSIFSAIFRWAIRQDYVPDSYKNPMDGLPPSAKRAKAEATSHRDYTDAELLAVFGSDLFRAQRDERPDRYWALLICLFSGCRREEPSQMNLSAVIEMDGIPCFYFAAEDEDQSLKTDCSKRTVPIHSALIQLGFLEYVQGLRKAGHTRLFPTLKKNKSTFADAAGKWYARLIKTVGLGGKGLVQHGLRHTFITRLADAGVSERIRQILVGHAAQGIHSRVYDHRERVSMVLLREGLEHLKYEAVQQALMSGVDQRESKADSHRAA